MTEKLFEAALEIALPWHAAKVDFNAAERALTIRVAFKAGSRQENAAGLSLRRHRANPA